MEIAFIFRDIKCTEVSLIQNSLNIGNVPGDSNQNDEWVRLFHSCGNINEA